MKKIKVQKVDTEFATLIKERDNWTCQKCGKYYPEGNRRGIECSHIFSRRNYSTRWHPLNAKALCTRCHMDWHANPVDSTAWIRDYLGESKYQELINLKNTPMRYRDKDKREMIAHFKAEFSRLEDLRAAGEAGRIEIKPWVVG